MEPHLIALALATALGLPLCAGLPRLLTALRLERRNYRGRPILTGGGLAFLAVSLPWLFLPTPEGRWVAAAALGFGALGLLDDFRGGADAKGMRGHLRALLRGRVTTGSVKAVGGLLLAGALALRVSGGWEAAVVALLVALAANTANLFDLRPLRALKLFWLGAALLATHAPPVLWAMAGLSLPYARLEGRGRVMLGDTGANALGAALGATAALALPRWAAAGVAAALLAFHLWAEKRSLTAWIEARPWARALDRWGRAEAAGHDGPEVAGGGM